MAEQPLTLASDKVPYAAALPQLKATFEAMMHALYQNEGATFRVEILGDDPVQNFISTHAAILDSSFDGTAMTGTMRQALQRSNYIFSGIKTFHELNEAFPSLIDDSGNRKPFERFLRDVRKIDETYNSNYLRAEYNFVHASADMAARWEQIEQDGDRYLLQYRTAGDGNVRPEHAALNGVTLPPSDTFWQSYYPPNGWNCRCTVVQVRRGKYETTPHEEAMQRGAKALQRDARGIFRFNAGQQRKAVPDYNPYTIKRCRDCDIAKADTVPGNSVAGTTLAFVPENELCAACRLLRTCYGQGHTKEFKEYKKQKVAEAGHITLSAPELGTGNFYQTRKSFKRGISHARNISEAEMFVEVNSHISELQYVRKSPLGEGKDLANQKDAANIQRKKDRGITHYNVYELTVGNTVWEVKTEVYKNKAEAVYNLYIKK